MQKNAALSAFGFALYDSSGSPAIGLVPTCQRSLDGAAFGNCTNSPAEIGSGAYKVDLAAGDLNADVIILKLVAPGAQTQLITLTTAQP